jgi:tRNA dimethylallyltransferase
MAIKVFKKNNGKPRLPRVVFVVGPTASGKTDIALALCEKFNGEIINADARQVYQQIEIGTGKPAGNRGVSGGRKAYFHHGNPHYLMGFLPPTEAYSAAEWREAALKAIQGITARKRLPIVVGGTGLYIASLVDNLSFPNVEAHPAFRKAYEEKSLQELVALLLMLDPGAHAVVDLQNKRRVIRALEVITFTGKKYSELRAKGEPIVDALQLGVIRTPEELRGRINSTIDRMFETGLVREVRDLLKSGIPETAPALTAIGYRTVTEYLNGKTTLEDAIIRFKHLTWQYAKRQQTWFKRDPRIHWIKDDHDAVRTVGEWVMRG